MADDSDIGAGNVVQLVAIKQTWRNAIVLAAVGLVATLLVIGNGFAAPAHPLHAAPQPFPTCNADFEYCPDQFQP